MKWGRFFIIVIEFRFASDGLPCSEADLHELATILQQNDSDVPVSVCLLLASVERLVERLQQINAYTSEFNFDFFQGFLGREIRSGKVQMPISSGGTVACTSATVFLESVTGY